MPAKFFFHRTATTVSGTLPATNAALAGPTPTWTPGATNSVANTPLLTNLSMDGTVSPVAQTSLAYTTDNVTTNQQQPLLRFISAPLVAQTIAIQVFQMGFGISGSNSSTAFSFSFHLAVWRPGTGALVGTLRQGVGSLTSTVAGTSETNATIMGAQTSAAVTAQNGDVLVFELWRSPAVQSMATSYTNTVFYDGRTEFSATDNAAHILFTNNIALQAPPITASPSVGMATASGALTKRQRPAGTPLPFVDNFDSGALSANWSTWGTGTQTQQSGTLNQTATGVSGQYVGVSSVGTLDCSFGVFSSSVEIVQIPTSATGNQAYLRVEADANNAVIIGYSDGNLFCQRQTGGSFVGLATFTWPSGCRGLRVWINAGWIFWDYTINGSTWLVAHQQATPIALSALRVSFGAGCYQTVASPGIVRWDNFNAPTPTDPYGAAVYQDAGLLAYWRMNEKAGATVVRDWSTGEHHANTAGSLGFDQPGALANNPDTALDFGAPDGWLAVDPEFHIAGSFTLECWLKADTWVQFGSIFNRRRWEDNTGGIVMEPQSGVIRCFIYNTAETWQWADAGALSTGEWHYVVMVYDVTQTTIWVYVDGAFVAGNPSAGVLKDPAVAYIQMGRNVSEGQLFDGLIDEVALYDWAFLPGDVLTHYQLGTVQPGVVSGSAAGKATVSGALSVRRVLTGATVGRATVTAVLSRRRSLTGASSGKATTFVIVSRRRAVFGTASGSSSTTAVLQRVRSLAGTSSGKATASGALTRYARLVGAATGVAVTTAVVGRRRALSGAALGAAATTAAISRKRSVAASAQGQASASGVPTAYRRLVAGASSGLATTSGAVGSRIQTTRMESTAVLGTPITLLGRVVLGSPLKVRVTQDLIGGAVGTAVLQAVLTAYRAVAGTSQGKATVTGSVSTRRSLAGVSAGRATTTATISRRRSLSALAQGRATTTGQVNARRALVGAAFGRATVIGIPGVLPTTVVTWTGDIFEIGGAYIQVRWASGAFQSTGTGPRLMWDETNKRFIYEEVG